MPIIKNEVVGNEENFKNIPCCFNLKWSKIKNNARIKSAQTI